MPTEIVTHELPEALRFEMEGPIPFASYVSNGCTFSPDFLSGVDLRPACHWHDYSYFLGGFEECREAADYAFYRNCIRCGVSKRLAGVYFRRVRLWGIRHYAYLQPPKGLALAWLYVRVFFGRYVRW